MKFTSLCLVLIFALVNISAGPLIANDNIESLIDQLAEIGDEDTGYAPFFAGTGFVPYKDSQQLSVFIIGATQRETSPVMKRIVEAGFDAVPQLLKHLGDERKTKMPPIESGGMSWIAFDNEYDFNRTLVDDPSEKIRSRDAGSPAAPDTHEITVGDLCFVALGQIVNRYWSAVRYQPTAGQIINSPTHSKGLRQAVLDEWGQLNRETHKDRLIQDFRSPEDEERLIGAYLRLSLYYPEEVEPLVVNLLSRPIADGDKASGFAEELAEIKDPAERKRKLNEILALNGEHYRHHIEEIIFEDIWRISGVDKDSGPLDPKGLLAVEIAEDTFGWPKPVTYGDSFTHPKLTFNNYEMARIIRALTHDDSPAIGEAIKSILESGKYQDDTYFVKGCLTSLASRSQYGDYLADKLRIIDFQKATQKDLPHDVLAAIATSKWPAVHEQLDRIVGSCNDPVLFNIAARAVLSDNSKDRVLARAKQILKSLTADTEDGDQLLALIVEQSPQDTESVLNDFLEPNTPSRCNTVCEVLWDGNPLSQKILAHLLDDHRQIWKGSRMDVRTRAAQAISHSIDTIEFDSDWSDSLRDKAILEIKEYCEKIKSN